MAQSERDAAGDPASLRRNEPANPGRRLLDDGELARRIIAGDRIAEVMLVKRYANPIAAILRRHGADHNGIADLVQDTFEAVLTALRTGSLRSHDRLLAFMLQTARNIANNTRRREARRRTSCDLDAIALAVDASLTPFDALLRQDRRRAVLRMMEQLVVRRDRQLLIRYYCDGQERKALQAEFGLTPDQFDKVLSRARRRLRLLATAAQMEDE